ncbi:hypothetical protein [Amycolatopsis sp. lyj-346]
MVPTVTGAGGGGPPYTARACGWANPSHFIAAFTAVVGVTPGRHRSGVSG